MRGRGLSILEIEKCFITLFGRMGLQFLVEKTN
jgi:hypothetical protein